MLLPTFISLSAQTNWISTEKLKIKTKQVHKLGCTPHGFAAHPMEAVGATEEFLDELLIGQFGDVGCPHR